MKINSSIETTCVAQVANARDGQAKQRFVRKHLTTTSTSFLRIASAVVILLLVGIYAHAQTTSGTILGTLTEQTGAVVTNTQVTLNNIATSATRRTMTNGEGFYQFVSTPPGNYRITVAKAGFKTIIREPINLPVEGSVRINLTLEVGTESQRVTVTARTPLVQAGAVSLGTVIDQRETNDIPLNGRNALNLVALVPSVVPLLGAMGTQTGSNNLEWGNYQIGGGFANENIVLIDGAPVNTEFLNTIGLIPSQDSIQEFKVDTNNLPASYGRLAGGAVNFRTKSGTNSLHGSAWEFLRNKVLNANTFFSNRAGLPRPPFTQNQYGFNAGGPVYIPHLYDGRNKTFFFVNWEGFGLRQGETFAETVPTAAERAGDLSALQTPIYDPNTTCGASPGVACAPGEPQYNRQEFANGIIPTARLNPTALLYLKQFYPMPNTPGGPLGVNNYTSNASVGGNNYQTVVHIDENVSDKQHISGRYTHWLNNNLSINPFNNAICQDRCAEIFTVNNLVLNDTYAFNSKTILDVLLSWQRFVYNRSAKDNTFSLTTIGMPASLASQVQFPGPPIMTISGFDTAGTFSSQGSDATIRDATDDDRITASLTRFIGNHTLKIGGEFLRATFNYAQANTSAGLYSFDDNFTGLNPLTGGGGTGLASYLLGYPASGSMVNTIPTAAEHLYPAIYVTDDWRATSRLTLNLGVRWEDQLPWTERHDRMSYFDTATINPLLHAAGLDQYPGSSELVASSTRSSRHNTDNTLTQFSPRMGLSYEAAPSTVFSLGYGIFYLPLSVEWTVSPNNNPINTFNTPYTASIDGGLTPSNSISDPFPGGITPAPGRNPSFQRILLGTGITMPIPNRNPYSYAQQWNVRMQQQLGSSFKLDVAYGGAKGTHLLFYNGIQIDQLPDQDLQLGSALNKLVPNPFYGVINPNYSLGAARIPAGQLLRKYPQYNGVNQANYPFADSTYNSLQVTAEKRFSGGASLNAAYTWAKLISDTDSPTPFFQPSATSVQDSNNLKAEKSLSSSDVRQVLVLSYVYDIPVGHGQRYLPNASRMVDYAVGGWGLEGITTLMGGFPLEFRTNQNLTNSFGGGSRPNYILGCHKSTSGGAVPRLNHWFNTACFTQPPAFTFGNEPRVDPELRAPGIANWDSSLFKNFAMDSKGRINVQFRAEVFNLFNRVQFGYPGLTLGTSNFGVISSQVNLPRILQFALRVNY